METYVDNTPLWDLSQASNFSQLADDDFLAILQKQFPITQDAGYVNGVNPQNITRLPLPTMTPPSEDSSPSPPNLNDSGGTEEQVDSAQKRKANEGDLDDESPSSKTQHTTNKKATTRRKSAGASGQPKDESRLLKRKEQNRAAQRAFRERKEKHVKDLEDKVAALEAKNEAAVAENENLRDLLSRLQQENLSLKQASFTFAVPKTGVTSENTQASTSFASQSPDFASSSSLSPATPVSSSTSTFTPKMTNPLDWSSLTSFDPNMLNLLDDTPQPTATDGAMQMDFGFGTRTALPSNGPVDWSNLSSWQSPSVLQETPSLDDLLAGYLTHGGSNTAYVPSSSSVTSESPVTHHASAQVSSKPSPKSLSSSSSPSSSASDPLFDTPRDSSVSDSDVQEAIEKQNKAPCTGNGCPKTKGELADRISAAGSSPFAPMPLRKTSDAATGPMISCAGTKFPTTVKSDQNIEVLSAWRSITSNPRFKDVDINDLCAEFTSKAKCDGTKVVLEPQGVNSILQTLTGPKK
ncbi:AP-1-like transcription factor [Termitomyces sp. J132]|nr:AP-1-like transcription factor [Termitomyces sp. J132]